MPDLPSRSISSVSSLTCLESEPWCNSTLSNVFCFSIDDKRSDSPRELVNSKTGEVICSFFTYSIILVATSSIIPSTNTTSTS